MSKLFSLPDDIVASILGEWICLRELTMIDSSLCCQTERNNLLVLYPSEKFTVSIHEKTDHKLEWVRIRNIKIRRFCLSFGDKIKNIVKEIKVDLSLLNSLTITVANIADGAKSPSEKDIIWLINSCPSLTSLTLTDTENITDSTIEKIDLQIFRQLTEISVGYSWSKEPLTINTLQYIIDNCVNIRKLDIRIDKRIKKTSQQIAADKTVLTNFIEKNKKLRVLNVNGIPMCDAIITLLSKNCRFLQEMYFFETERLNLGTLSILVLSCPKLRCLSCGHFMSKYSLTYTNNTYNNYNKLGEKGKHFELRDTIASSTELLFFFTKITDFHSIKLVEVEKLNDQIVTIISSNNPNLYKVEFSECDDNFSSVSLKNLVFSCQKLDIFRMKGCNHIDCDDWVNILDGHSIITELYLSGLYRLEVKPILNIIHKNKRIIKASFPSCALKGADEKTIQDVLSARSGVMLA